MPDLPSAPEALPLFPLGTVLVPGGALPLRVFEPRYRLLLTRLLARPEDERVFGVVAIREGHEVGADAVRSLHEVGCTARVTEVERLADGSFEIVTVGVRRFDVHTVHQVEPYLTAEVGWLPEDGGPDDDAMAAEAAAAFERYRHALSAASGITVALEHALPSEPGALAYALTAAVVVDLRERQCLLEEPSTTARLLAIIRVLRRETVLASVVPSLPAGDLARSATCPN